MAGTQLDFSQKKPNRTLGMEDEILSAAELKGSPIELVMQGGRKYFGKVREFNRRSVSLVGSMGGQYVVRRSEIAAVIARKAS